MDNKYEASENNSGIVSSDIQLNNESALNESPMVNNYQRPVNNYQTPLSNSDSMNNEAQAVSKYQRPVSNAQPVNNYQRPVSNGTPMNNQTPVYNNPQVGNYGQLGRNGGMVNSQYQGNNQGPIYTNPYGVNNQQNIYYNQMPGYNMNNANRFEGMDVKTIIRKTRHAAEIPLRIIAIIASCGFYMFNTFLGMLSDKGLQAVADIMNIFLGDTTFEDVKKMADLGFFGNIIFLILIIIIMLYAVYEEFAIIMSRAIRVTPNNFPEIYAKSVEYAGKLGLKKVPDVYIKQSSGVLNAFSTFVLRRKYVVLNAEVVDIAYLEHKDLDSVLFIMAHEFGHIYLHHTTLWLHLTTLGSKFVPFLGPAFSRAQEYSADRVAQALTNNTHGVDSMVMLMAGRHLYKRVDVEDYVAQVDNYNFVEKIARFIYNVFMSHPIMPWRIKALRDPQRRSGKLF